MYLTRHGWGRYCSLSCRSLARHPPLWVRLWAKVDIRGAEECWPWLATAGPRGYGRISIGHRSHGVTRLILGAMLGRRLAPEEWALHTCDNPPCCNPNHLYLGDPAANTGDMLARRRGVIQRPNFHLLRNNPRGERHHSAKLTAPQVLEARALYYHGASIRSLARKYGVAWTTMQDAINGHSWAHLSQTPPPA